MAREFGKRLESLPPPVVQHGPVAVAIRAGLWGGFGGWPMIPKEWEVAIPPGESLTVPDGILAHVWPD